VAAGFFAASFSGAVFFAADFFGWDFLAVRLTAAGAEPTAVLNGNRLI
jgi:hypothetical protein